MKYAAAPFLALYALWVFYLAVMCLQRAKEESRLRKPALILGYPVLIVGVLLDVLVNLTFGSLLFLERPRCRTVTGRLKFHRYDTKWRGKMSRWICANLLDTFDPSGAHCD